MNVCLWRDHGYCPHGQYYKQPEASQLLKNTELEGLLARWILEIFASFLYFDLFF